MSVVIPHYGDPRHALALVDDLRHQSPSVTRQIIVVDDHSPTPFPETVGVEVIHREHNGGFGAAVNTGAAKASGDWLLIANSDVRIGPTLLAQLIEQAQPLMPAVVGPASADEQGRPEHTGRRFPTARHLAVTTALPLQRFNRSQWMLRLAGYVLPRGERPQRVDWLQGSLLVLPREVFAAAGGFDEGYYMYSEEVDLQRRLGDRGVPAWLLPDLTVTHTGGASTIGIVDVGERMIRSRLLYARKFGGERAARGTLMAVAVLNLVCRLMLRATGRASAPRLAWHREWRRARLAPSTAMAANRGG
ncbi:glycosyltransferase family 2 protein [Nocardioides glacieisoli]|uniref:glycosyltransferase family 2 protein n=1 Tax=Nocardioides glacieisoli TaxID=1168730 RepID=UPI0013ED625A|nr:glycosyltransferase family 2 protein [Nocardioides glacieisoli]